MTWKRYFPILLLITAVTAVQQATQHTGTAFYLTQLTMTAYYSLLTIALCVLMGYAGQISLGHAGFFSIGGYLAAGLTTHNFAPLEKHPVVALLTRFGLMTARQDILGDNLLSFHPWAAFGIALFATVLIAFLLGIPVLKLKGHYLAMATLSFGIIIHRIALAVPFFGEADGISEVPGFKVFPFLEVSGNMGNRVMNYYIAWSMVILGILLLSNLIHSRVGRALRAIHGAEDAAAAMGVPAARFKLHTFVLSAIFASIAGVFLTHYNGGIGPSEAGVMKSVRYVAIVAVGGMANIWGALIMSVTLNFLTLRGMFGTYDDAVFGAILIAIMLFAPQGLLNLSFRQLFARRRPDADKERQQD